jgi:FixJ family two-component response regulator
MRHDPVFVVDDDGPMRTSIGRLLREHGFKSVLLDSAQELLSHGGRDKAICFILDVNLNGKSGFDLGRQIAAERGAAPVIYITGNDSQANRADAAAAGCIAYLIKPFPAQSLIDSIALAEAAV